MRTVPQRHVFTASVPKLFQTIEWAFLILCQKVRKNPVFKSNTEFSVSLIPTLDITFQLNILPIEKKKPMKFRSQVSTISFPCLNSSILG